MKSVFRVKNKKILFLAGLNILMLGIVVVLLIKYSQQKSRLCKNCNVILISLDTLAANHLPCYGYERNTAPNLCQFAKNNIMFSNSYSNSHWTLPSHMSIFSSLYSSTNGVFYILKDKLNTKYETLPQLFKNNGYKTIFSGPGDDPYLPLRFGFGRGFDSLFSVPTYNTINIDSWDEALDMFKKNTDENQPTFMFLHTYAVHAPYIPGDKENYKFVTADKSLIPKTIEQYYVYSPEKIQKMIGYFEDRIKNSDTPQSLDRNKKMLAVIKEYGLSGKYEQLDQYIVDIFPEEKNSIFRQLYVNDTIDRTDFYKDLYDEVIYNLDEKMTKIFNLVKDKKLAKDTIIVITSDHGESFTEHDENIGHAEDCPNCLYNETIKVPMIMYIPGVKNKKIDGLIQGIDIYPTLAELTGIKYPRYIEGLSMVGQIFGDILAPKNKYIISESNLKIPQKVIVDKKWKLDWKYDQKQDNIALYDLTKDPKEKNNVADKNPKIVQSRLDILKKFMARPNIDKSNGDTKFPDWLDKIKRDNLMKGGYF